MNAWVADIEQATLDNTNFRTVLWTGEHTQLTVMLIGAGDDIGLEQHPDHDQFIRIEQGKARVELGPTEDRIEETHEVEDDWAIIVPAKEEMMWIPSTRSLFASATTFTKPSVSRLVLARLLARNGNLPTFTSPRAFASSSVRPTPAISGWV